MIAKDQRVVEPKPRKKTLVSTTLRRKIGEDELREHIESMHDCFPEWGGPKVSSGNSGYCENEGYGLGGGFLGAHILITHVSGHVIEGEVAYGKDAPEHCIVDNGTKVRLHITDIWPPVWLL